ncbi:Hypothetical predicted protein [Cloeon dipterum]|uniref:Neurotransmitter-gated ion-channel ligand-binding domain-containing protein n=1 Tax=Cloeon dipterum TaxID=197152 RepID=A0A8S1C957_9INSE|nr:Hypothetical predicted protein [Cloeon dipterum]
MQMFAVLFFNLLSLATSAPTHSIVSTAELSLEALFKDYDAIRCNNKRGYPDLEENIRKYSVQRYTEPSRESVTDITCWMNREFKIEFFSIEVHTPETVDALHIERLNSLGMKDFEAKPLNSLPLPVAAAATNLNQPGAPRVWP